ncbi:hypothetical protein DUNSADRAFT_9245, partial [Dunaliella salina]
MQQARSLGGHSLVSSLPCSHHAPIKRGIAGCRLMQGGLIRLPCSASTYLGPHDRERSACSRMVLQPVPAAATDQQATDEPPEGFTQMSYIDYLNFEFGIPDVIQFSEGVNGLPRAWIRHPYSASGFEVYLHGAAITQWLRPDGAPALNFNPRTTSFDSSRLIKGGMRLAFPAYRENTQMSEDGFAGRLPWEVVAAGFDFMGLDDGMRSKEYDEALERFDQMEQEAMQRGYWLPENQGEETKRGFDEMEQKAMQRGYWLPENQGEETKRVRIPDCMQSSMHSHASQCALVSSFQ